MGPPPTSLRSLSLAARRPVGRLAVIGHPLLFRFLEGLPPRGMKRVQLLVGCRARPPRPRARAERDGSSRHPSYSSFQTRRAFRSRSAIDPALSRGSPAELVQETSRARLDAASLEAHRGADAEAHRQDDGENDEQRWRVEGHARSLRPSIAARMYRRQPRGRSIAPRPFTGRRAPPGSAPRSDRAPASPRGAPARRAPGAGDRTKADGHVRPRGGA